jgi:hypothetical protein
MDLDAVQEQKMNVFVLKVGGISVVILMTILLYTMKCKTEMLCLPTLNKTKQKSESVCLTEGFIRFQ